jgi:hypothetical protein
MALKRQTGGAALRIVNAMVDRWGNPWQVGSRIR